MKIKNILFLAAVATFAVTACSVDANDEDDTNADHFTTESSAPSYVYTSRIDQVTSSTKTYCDTKSENAGLNGYLDASISGFGVIAVTVNQLQEKQITETILEIKLPFGSSEEFVKSVCDEMIDEEDAFSKCDVEGKTIVSITNDKLDHIMDNTTMTKALDDLCATFEGYETTPDDATYAYKHLTYCEIYEGATADDSTFYDCEQIPVKKVDAPTISLTNVEGDIYTVGAYFGDEDDKGIIEENYNLVGFDSDSLGSYWEFTGEEDIVRIYGPDFTVMRAKDDSYYYTWSQWDDLY